MALKDIDFKGILLEKGERYGLILAGGVMALLVGLGLFSPGKGFFSGSPHTTASEIKKLQADVDGKIANAPIPNEPIANNFLLAIRGLSSRRIKPTDYSAPDPFFIVSPAEDTRLRNPDVLTPNTNFQLDLVHAPVMIYNIRAMPGGKFQVRVLDDKSLSMSGGFNFGNRTRGGLGDADMGSGEGGGRGMMPGGGGGFPGGLGGGPGGGGLPGAAGGMLGGAGAGVPGQGTNTVPTYRMRWLDAGELAKRQAGYALAQTIAPRRIVVVQGSFPLKQQLEEFRQKLKKQNLVELIAAIQSGETKFKFNGLEIHRRRLTHDGQPVEEWADYTKSIEGSFRFLAARMVQPEPDDPRIDNIGLMINDGLVMARPQLLSYQDQNLRVIQEAYPAMNLKELNDTIEEQMKLYKDSGPPQKTEFEKRLAGDSGDPFNPRGYKEEFDPNLAGMQPGGFNNQMQPGFPGAGAGTGGGFGAAGGFAGPGGIGGMRQGPGGIGVGVGVRPGTGENLDPEAALEKWAADYEKFIPENCLLRFLDVTVTPGYTYEYKIKVRMVNPNHGKKDQVAAQRMADAKELVGKEVVIPQKIYVPHDSYYYAVDEKFKREDRDLMNLRPNERENAADATRAAIQIHRWVPEVTLSAENQLPVGDWSVLDRLLCHRGEYIGRPVETKVATWVSESNVATLATNAVTKRNFVTVDFSVRHGLQRDPALLVDFRGTVPEKVAGRDVRDDGPYQLLILTPDGKLQLRNSKDDTDDERRKKRYETWKRIIKDLVKIKQGTAVPGGGAPGSPPGGLFNNNRGGPGT